MALSALKFIGLAVGAVALGALSASFAFGQMGPEADGLAAYGPNGRLALNYESKVTEDEIPDRIRHIMWRH